MQSEDEKLRDEAPEERTRRMVHIEMNATPGLVLTAISAALFVAVMTVVDLVKLIIMLIR